MRFPDLTVLALVLLVLPRYALTSTVSSTSSPAPTCPYRTINYITHSLPQQCLTSTRKVNTSPETGGPTTTGSATSGPPLSTSTPPTNETTVESPTPATSSLSTTTTTTTTQSTAASTQVPSPEGEDVSPLEEGKFLSFEDWKRENLKKSGQSDQIGHRPAAEPSEPRKRSSIDQGSLDSLGDDAEIDLDFSGFVSDGLDTINQPKPRPPQPASDSPTVLEPDRGPRAGLRSKDAGKTCKERSNYASFDCGADVIKYNPEAKSALAILGKNKDAYMLNECSAQNKYVILELCNHIAIDTIVVANFEFFSSIFRTFRVTVSDKYPVKADKWKSIGTFEARNTREVQAFLVENPVIWARYVRIEFLTHYGNEYYCPVSLVRIHGTTMLEEYNHDLESLQTDYELESEVPHSSDVSDVSSAISATSATSVESTSTSSDSSVNLPVKDQMSDMKQENATTTELDSTSSQVTEATTSSLSETTSPDTSNSQRNSSQVTNAENRTSSTNDCTSERNMSYTAEHSVNLDQMASNATSFTAAASANSTSINSTSSSATQSPSTGTKTEHPVDIGSNATSIQSNNSSSIKSTSTSSSVNSTKVSGSSTQPAPAAPTMQESFFKSVQKRLQMLESNSSLSLQYIEEQSRALRDAFRKVEQRQLAKTTSFLDQLNATVLNELREFRQQYDQLWQSTVIELEMQRERYQQENGAINARLGVLADELIFQKRMAFLQMMLILTCLGLIIFSKGNLNSYLELPLVQSVLARSPSAKWSNTPITGTPNHSPAVTRNNSARSTERHGILKGHRRVASEDSTTDAQSPADLYSPPTPVSLGETSEDDDGDNGRGLGNDQLGDPQFDPSLIERPSTSPPELPGTETPSTPTEELDLGNTSIDSILQPDPNNAYVAPPLVTVEAATPPSKHLKWRLPDS
ncbi:hypothetical protein PV10_05927 [Exophiala mesophila]|uniref:SUN-like protein 1 n=1 Tax=Exophiala mesophila TaxID=212818 RepID=A0A0D1ZX37_EXOME|nr:uncharacterized protein PV10_05927 [Exophiala mesophila]KIV91383.1 hypothetical protein PV10_05927 [Exophiala mesophila]